MLSARKILIVEDDVELVRLLNAVLSDLSVEVHVAGNGRRAINLMSEFLPAVLLMELQLPDMTAAVLLQHLREQGLTSVPIVIAPATRGAEIRPLLTRGVYDYLTKPLDFDRVCQSVRNAIERFDLVEFAENHRDGTEISSLGELRGGSLPMLAVYKSIKEAAKTKEPVLVIGQPGTERREAAEALHAVAGSGGPFQMVNAGNVSPDEIRPRLAQGLQTCAGGVCFIENVQMLDTASQGLLLSYLCGEGDGRARVVAGGDGRLSIMVQEGRFSAELQAILSKITISLPRLSERGDDALFLAESFLLEASAALEKSFHGIANDAEHTILFYDWPGNVAELRLAIHHAVSHHGGPVLRSNMLPQRVRHNAERISGDTQVRYLDRRSHIRPLWEVEREAIENALREADGNPQHAARLLGITAADLHRRWRRLKTHR